jgi:hypothetical protein
MAKKIYQVFLGKFGFYNSDEGFKVISNEFKKFPAEFLEDLKRKRPRFFDKIKIVKKDLIHRPPIPGTLSINGAYGCKFLFEGPKWPIRKIMKWKRPKKKKWLNNRRVYK